MIRSIAGGIAAILLASATLIPSSAQAQKVEDILKAHYKAVGQEKLEKAKTIVATGSMTIMGMDGPMTRVIKRPNQMRSELAMMGMSVVSVVNGDKGYTSLPGQGVKEVTGDELKGTMDNISLDDRLYEAEKNKATITLVGTQKLNTADVYKLRILYTSGDSSFAYLDTKSSLMLKLESTRSIQGTTTTIEANFSDFKTFEGVTLPGTVQASAMGQDVTIKTDKVVFNGPVEATAFDKPKQ